jgi:Cu-Zn family superoxide dismutase
MKRTIALALAFAAGLAGCSSFEPQGPRASARLQAASGSTVWGAVSFVETGKGVLVRADVRNLRAGGEFGFHVHENGNCGPGDGMNAGGHLNPAGKPHARYDNPERHAGDLLNLRSDAEGNATYVFETTLLTVRPGPNSVVGRAIVIHADRDDYTTQPDGNAGKPIACGLIIADD